MAARKDTDNLKSTKKTQTAQKKPSASSAEKNTSKGKASAGKNREINKAQEAFNFPILEEVCIWGTLALSVIIFISNFGIGGYIGNAISSFFFGVFGFMAYLFPVILFLLAAFLITNKNNKLAWVKTAASVFLIFCICAILELAVNSYDVDSNIMTFYKMSAEHKSGGGLVGGIICSLICPAFGVVGACVLVFLVMILCLVIITERSLFADFRRRGQKVYANAREDAALRRERAAIREEKQRIIRSEQRKMRHEQLEAEKKELEHLPEQMRQRQKVSGVNLNSLNPRLAPLNEVHEVIPPLPKEKMKVPKDSLKVMDFTVNGEPLDSAHPRRVPEEGPSLPFVDQRFPEPELSETEDFEDNYGTLNEQRPSSFEEQLRINGELASQVFKEEELSHTEKTEHQDPMESILPESDEESEEPEEADYQTPLRKPLFLQPADETEDEKESFSSEEIPAFESGREATIYDGLAEDNDNEMHEITGLDEEEPENYEEYPDPEPLVNRTAHRASDQSIFREDNSLRPTSAGTVFSDTSSDKQFKNPRSTKEDQKLNQDNVAREIAENVPTVKKEYIFPSLDLLNEPKVNSSNGREQELRETAMKLQQTLHNFGVGVRVTNVSCGPSVTRYELTPDQGVKVSRIVNLSDDIKLNLAAADIRIEAPIPGKAAVGIEVPNKTNNPVFLRELLETPDFKSHSSSLAFAAGKDIAGKAVVADIAKMPHLLIAGATGSGKSVCINTIIMSILYKARPDDVKLIMIDPKVVELSVYNGIPHLLIPVVTDPKKASGALNWAVAEMTDRYQKFAECNVRDLKGYNKKVEALQEIPGDDKPEKLPQILIIVDELADLMMVAPGEVEDAICRLAQLARAAGIHLIIATQRPSVNVITGLIKANMPSRIAFAVSSGVDSRTIIDMVGAEKLLGKGDMLFYPQGYQKPARVQGAFVSDNEVSEVVKFLTEQNGTAPASPDIESKITAAQGMSSDSSAESEIDEYFEKAGRFIIEKDKASIGMLQRLLKIGFNRAARIMDQLADAGVVGPEEGTKPRKILMSMEEFEDYLSNYV